ncbi:MAG: tRNA pseudouridine synthase A [Spirochaetaceae bacterium]|jgi:tRNA pseudouridine38-40 synthase|nr:tRNA pseudouridine synthase A [Spirochaetaceae bacterium]
MTERADPPPEARNIRLTLAYDGTAFCGWQAQSVRTHALSLQTAADAAVCRRTVQGVVEAALEKMHQRRVPLAGAGRTDSGVHAAGQCANFFTTIASMDAGRFVPALNSLLPPDVRVLDASLCAPEFHARFDAKFRVYRYFLICGRQALPHESRYALNLRRTPDIQRLNSYCRILRGELDCSLFASPRDSAFTRGSGSRFRFIRNAAFWAAGGRVVFEVSANAFFWKMVRSMLGTLLWYEERGADTAQFAAVLAGGERANAGPTAAPAGLFLWRVEY